MPKYTTDMKPVNPSFLSRLCMALLSLLGFAACEEPMCEYGCPTIDYKISGTVTNAEGTPIEGIRVIVPEVKYDYERNCFVSDTVFTDAEGHYSTSEHTGYPTLAERGIFFDDVDGDAHGGSFAADSLSCFEVNNTPRKQYKEGDGNWYVGGYEYTVDKKLRKQE